MYRSLGDYLKELKYRMKNCDKAIVQDAVSDASEFITNYISNNREELSDSNPQDIDNKGHLENNDVDLLNRAIIEFGEADEIVENYRQIDNYLNREKSPIKKPDLRPWYTKFLMIITDPKAWGSLLYMVLSLAI